MTAFAERIHYNSLKDSVSLCDNGSDDLLIDTGELRYWMSRMTEADGQPYNDAVTIERLMDGAWVTVLMYDPHNPFA